MLNNLIMYIDNYLFYIINKKWEMPRRKKNKM